MSESATMSPDPGREEAGGDTDVIDTDVHEPELQALSEEGDVESTSGAVAAAAFGLAVATGQWKDIRRRFVRNKLAVVGVFMILFIVIVAIFAPEIAPYKPNAQDLFNVQSPPSAKHWFGTDIVGRDQLTRVHVRRPYRLDRGTRVDPAVRLHRRDPRDRSPATSGGSGTR